MSETPVTKTPNVRLAIAIAFVAGLLLGGTGVFMAGDQAHDRLRASHRKLQEANRELLVELGRGDPPPSE